MDEKYNEYLKLINERLFTYLPSEDKPWGAVSRAAGYSLSAGGKRLRPVLTLAFCELCGGKARKALDAACAVEFVHTYSLIHDDLPCMDDDALRRGKPSCHKAFGEATALLAGDALLTHAFGIIAASDTIRAETAVKCIAELSARAGIDGMIGGQQLDTENEGTALEKPLLLSMYSMKTSALLAAACICGVYCAENPDPEKTAAYIKSAADYAYELGIAFQITDDILDVTGDEKELGKPIGSDEISDKRTYVSVCGIEAAQREAVGHTERALEILEGLESSEFLRSLTLMLLNRKK